MDISTSTYPFQRDQPFELPEELSWLRRNDPVSRVRLANGTGAWLVTRYDDVRAVLADPVFSRSLNDRQGAAKIETGSAFQEPEGGYFAFGSSIVEPPGHTRWRRIVSQAFTARHAETMRPRIREIVAELLAEIAELDQVDLMSAFAFRFPMRVIFELLGVPADGQPVFAEWAAQVNRMDSAADFQRFGEVMSALGRYVVGLISRKRREPGPDLLSELIEVHDDDRTRLSNDELVSTVFLLLMAGYESTATQLGNACYALFHHPDQLAKLRDAPELIEVAVEEILRYAQIGTGWAIAKHTTEDVVVGGVTIPANSTVFVSLGSANRDESRFDAADEFDVGRRRGCPQLAFGAGPHYCLGAALARVELQEAITGLLGRFPGLRLLGDVADVELASNLFTYYPRRLPVAW
ncbi:MAG TPA: cytochrome P450 [Pseudonocardiaceae bacterium]|nr:cytochrome P450 [Pseudonocardiaceae bacterium]